LSNNTDGPGNPLSKVYSREEARRIFRAAGFTETNTVVRYLNLRLYPKGDQLAATALARSNLAFNFHAILGGQLEADPSPTLFYLYPEGNWIEAAADTPYFVIGRTPYSKPILDRFLVADVTLSTAVKLAYLAFDATRISVTDVDFPLDLLVLNATNQCVTTHRFTADMLATPQVWWQHRLQEALSELPIAWATPLLPGAEQNSDR
jgi:putative proteasome-type protease